MIYMSDLGNEQWASIAAELRAWDLGGGKIYYVPNNGNAGDALIGAGAWQFFERQGFNVELAKTEDIKKNDFVIYAGGGNLVPGYCECRAFLERCLVVGIGRAMVLPHTVRGNEDLLKKLDQRFSIFCRDYVTLRWVQENSDCNSSYAPDMAFGLDIKKLEEACSKFKNKVSLLLYLFVTPKQMVKFLRWKFLRLSVSPDASGCLKVFRVDIEATDIRGTAAMDLSNLYGSRYRSRFECLYISRDFMKTIDLAEHVKTNRLHVGVGAALLGKQTELHDNSYGKNRAIFDATIAASFNNVLMKA